MNANELKPGITVDLGLVHSSAAPSIGQLIIERLAQAGDIEENGVSPNFLDRNWPPAFREWSTKSVRDAFFASPQFPRLLNPESIKDTIARGVENGMLGYVGRKADGSYAPFHWNSSMLLQDVEISDDVFLIQRKVAEAYKAGRISPAPEVVGGTTVTGVPGPLPLGSRGVAEPRTSPVTGSKPVAPANVPRLVWSGDVPHQKWMKLLHEGSLEVRRNDGVEAHASSGGRSRRRGLAAEGRRDEGRVA